MLAELATRSESAIPAWVKETLINAQAYPRQ
jgi:hypothetical protein